VVTRQNELIIDKKPLQDKLYDKTSSPLQKYQDFYVGSRRLADLATFELLTCVLGPLPGALGLLLRKTCYPYLFKRIGVDVIWGRNIAIRYPNSIEIGDRVAFDDNCLIDAQGAGPDGIRIGNGVMVARGTVIQGKGGSISVGDQTVIGCQTFIGSAGGMQIGKMVMIAALCYIGGGRYHTDDLSTPMVTRSPYSNGPVIIEDDVWIGAGAIIQDGVKVGKGSVIGAGAVIREDVPPYTVLVPHQRLISLSRDKS